MNRKISDAQVWEIVLHHHVYNESHDYYAQRYGVQEGAIYRILKGKSHKKVFAKIKEFIETEGKSEEQNIDPRAYIPDPNITDTAFYYHDDKNRLLSVSFGSLLFVINKNNKVHLNTNEIITGSPISYEQFIELLRKKGYYDN